MQGLNIVTQLGQMPGTQLPVGTALAIVDRSKVISNATVK